ncbi:MAG: ABC transporter ATP-binding protein [Actinomycetota bacterium]
MDLHGSTVEFRNVKRTFGTVKALDDFSLTIEPGELVTLLGPSGCGKTTALRILAGIDKDHEGIVEIDGKDMSRVPANQRNIGMVFQAYSLFPNMTAIENVAYGLRVRGVDSTKRETRARELLDLVGLSTQADRRPTQLSGGQQQRVALARALAIEPSVLLLDEPLSALDAQVRSQLRDEIRRIQSTIGISTLFVTHDQEEAMAISDRVGVMNKGILEQIDDPGRLYNKPKTPFVAGFVGLTNYIPAVTESKSEVLVLNQVLDISDHSPAVKKGEEVRALIRPEELQVEKASDGAIIITKSFLGPVTRLGIDAGTSELIYAEVTSKEARKFDTGDHVAISINSDSVMIEYV